MVFEIGKLYTPRQDVYFGLKGAEISVDIKPNEIITFIKYEEAIFNTVKQNILFFIYDNKIIYRYSNNTYIDWFKEIKTDEIPPGQTL